MWQEGSWTATLPFPRAGPSSNPASARHCFRFSSRPQHALQLELAHLLVRLRQWQPATAATNKALERSREGLPVTENLQLDVEA